MYSIHMGRDDFKFNPFGKKSGLGKAWQLFLRVGPLMDELNTLLLA